jgi:hypothetical protein
LAVARQGLALALVLSCKNGVMPRMPPSERAAEIRPTDTTDTAAISRRPARDREFVSADGCRNLAETSPEDRRGTPKVCHPRRPLVFGQV